MTAATDRTVQRYRVVRNGEDQYSIWPQHKRMPPGWDDTGVSGSRQECLDHIARVCGQRGLL